ncbi:CAP domain-containing protein [Halobacillus karajensis]|nr:CAP domain-containing protein [Halobacillus karajensis]
MKKSLIVSGALALSLLVSPATSLASSGDVQYTYKIDTQNIQQTGENSFQYKLSQEELQSILDRYQKQWNDQQQDKPAKETQQQESAQEQPDKQTEAEPAPEQEQPTEEVEQEENNQQEASSEVSAFEKQVVELTNQEREKQGLEPLKLDTELSGVAKDKSLDMQKNDYFSHNSPTHGSPFDMMKSYGIDYRTAGENIAMGQTSPEQVVEGWMNSEGHRKNIMNPDFTHIGVGHAEDGNYWTQMFIGK